ncbi:hypothetical protein PAMA_014813 [Pampus argenteus]
MPAVRAGLLYVAVYPRPSSKQLVPICFFFYSCGLWLRERGALACGVWVWTNSGEAMATRKDGRTDRNPLEENYGESGSIPSPGDTLPWNLSKLQRVKRSKSASGEVLDPAERAVIRIAVREVYLRFIGVIQAACHPSQSNSVEPDAARCSAFIAAVLVLGKQHDVSVCLLVQSVYL